MLHESRAGLTDSDICLFAASDGVPVIAASLYPESILWHRSVRYGATHGRSSRGVIYITSAGSGGSSHMNTNYSEQKNSLWVIPVTGVSDMGRRIGNANPGANIVCAAPVRGEELPPVLLWSSRPANFPLNRPSLKNPPIEPDDVPWQWRRRSQGIPSLSPQSALNFNLNGTAAAAAQVAGIVALVLEKRPDLTARDVKEILLRSGRVVNDVRYDRFGQPLPYEPNGPGSGPQQTYPWPASGPHPSPALAEGPTQWRMSPLGRPLHHALGAGLIDAHKALKIAERWMLLPLNPFPPRSQYVLDPSFGKYIGTRKMETGGIYYPVAISRLIPLTGQPVEILLPPPPAGIRIEEVGIRVRFYHQRRGDLEIKLVAPAEAGWERGRTMVSDLFVPHREDFTESRWDQASLDLRNPTDWTFSTVRHWGMRWASNSGFWKLVIRDAVSKGATTTATSDDPVLCPKGNPTDVSSQRIEGVAITYHGFFSPASVSETRHGNRP